MAPQAPVPCQPSRHTYDSVQEAFFEQLSGRLMELEAFIGEEVSRIMTGASPTWLEVQAHFHSTEPPTPGIRRHREAAEASQEGDESGSHAHDKPSNPRARYIADLPSLPEPCPVADFIRGPLKDASTHSDGTGSFPIKPMHKKNPGQFASNPVFRTPPSSSGFNSSGGSPFTVTITDPSNQVSLHSDSHAAGPNLSGENGISAVAASAPIVENSVSQVVAKPRRNSLPSLPPSHMEPPSPTTRARNSLVKEIPKRRNSVSGSITNSKEPPAAKTSRVILKSEAEDDEKKSAKSGTTTESFSVEELEIQRGTERLSRIMNAMKEADIYIPPNNTKHLVWHQKILLDRDFQILVLHCISGFFIVLNALTLGVSVDIEPDWAGWIWVDAGFAVFFSMELIVKLIYQGRRHFCWGPERRWHWFETCTVLLSWLEVAVEVFTPTTNTSGLTLLRALRFVRVTRLLRVARLQAFAELMVMIKGALGGVKTLLWATLLICFALYSFAIFFRLALGGLADQGGGAEYFETLQMSFHTMFRCVVSKECSDRSGRPIFALVSFYHGWFYSFVYCCVDLIMTFGLFNVIVALFIENVLARAKTNEQLIKRKRLSDDKYFADKMAAFVAEIIDCHMEIEGLANEWRGGAVDAKEVIAAATNMDISQEVFDEVRRRPEAMEILRDLDVADEDSLHIFETLDADGSGALDMWELVHGIEKLRGAATRSDMVSINLMLQQVQGEIQNQGEMLDRVTTVLEVIVKNQQQSASGSSAKEIKGAALAMRRLKRSSTATGLGGNLLSRSGSMADMDSGFTAAIAAHLQNKL